MNPFLIVDGDGLAHRAYHSTPSSVKRSDGGPANAISGFFSMLARHIVREKPKAVFVGWDTLGVDTFRSELWPAYQTGRIFDPEIVEQLNVLPALCRRFGMGVGKAAGFEADDLIATVVRRLSEDDGAEILVLTSDKDAFQLVSEKVTVLLPQSGGKDPERITPTGVVQKLGVLPEQVVAFKALCGDPSDRIPGLKGVGAKTAANLLLRHGTLGEVLAHWSNPVEVELAQNFEKVVSMQFDAPLDWVPSSLSWAAGCAALGDFGLPNLGERLSGLIP